MYLVKSDENVEKKITITSNRLYVNEDISIEEANKIDNILKVFNSMKFSAYNKYKNEYNKNGRIGNEQKIEIRKQLKSDYFNCENQYYSQLLDSALIYGNAILTSQIESTTNYILAKIEKLSHKIDTYKSLNKVLCECNDCINLLKKFKNDLKNPLFRKQFNKIICFFTSWY